MRVLAVDVGASRIRVAFFKGEEIVWRREAKTPREGDSLSVARAIAELAPPLERFDVVSVATIGPLDLRRGWVVNTPNNPLRSFAIRDPLVEVYKAPVRVLNDCVAAAWGEYVLARRRRVRNLLYVTISSGIGGGAVVDGNLLLGRDGNAHEIGHFVVDYESDLLCGCGGRGHWEALAGGANIPKVARSEALRWREERTEAQRLAESGALDAPTLYSLARRGDRFATYLVEKINRIHAAGLASSIAAYDPEIVILGGGVVLNNVDLIVPRVAAKLREYLA
ncbi:MAG: ROK family protein, partial [Acidilobaceae archaeon]